MFEDTPYAPIRPAAVSDSRWRKARASRLVEDLPGLEKRRAAVGRVHQEVLGVVKEEDLDLRHREALERRGELGLEEVRRDAVPAVGGVLGHLAPRSAGARASHRFAVVRALDVARLRHDEEVLATRGAARHDVAHHLADENLAVAVRVVRGRVDERDPGDERLAEGLAMDVAPVVHEVAAEADPRDAGVDPAEGGVSGRGQAADGHPCDVRPVCVAAAPCAPVFAGERSQ